MKKWIATALCLMLLTGCAFAEETVRVHEMILEGMSEQMTETLYQNDDAYELWYPSDYLTPGERYGHPCFYPVGSGEENDIYFLIVPSEADPADAEGLLAEAVGGFGPDASIGEVRWTTAESGMLLGSVQAEEDGVIYRYYLAAGAEELLLITSCFPAEAAEGFGARFDRMAETISFGKLAMTGRYEGEGYAISYPAELLTCAEVLKHDGFIPAEGGAESGVYLMIVKSDVAPESGDSLLAEAVGGYENASEAKWGEEKALESGLLLNAVEIAQEEKIDRYYLVTDGEAVYCLTASFPAAGEADYGAAFDAMVETFEVMK